MKTEMKWSQSLPARHPDGIISSDVKLKNQKSFVPSYEKNPRQYNMYWILSDEYMRIWFREREEYSKYQYSAIETMAKENMINRRYVKRQPKKKDGMVPFLPPIKLKK